MCGCGTQDALVPTFGDCPVLACHRLELNSIPSSHLVAGGMLFGFPTIIIKQQRANNRAHG